MKKARFRAKTVRKRVFLEQVTGVGPADTSLGSWRHTDRRHLRLCCTDNITRFCKKAKRSAVLFLFFVNEKIVENARNRFTEKPAKNAETKA